MSAKPAQISSALGHLIWHEIPNFEELNEEILRKGSSVTFLGGGGDGMGKTLYLDISSTPLKKQIHLYFKHIIYLFLPEM